MKNFDLDKIVQKSKFGKAVSSQEKDFIIEKINHPKDEIELSQAIKGFGLNFPPNKANIKLIESFLSSESDFVISETIRVLCYSYFWNLIENYIDVILPFLDKEKAYKFSETQIVIFDALGDYLNKTSDPEIFKYIYTLFIKEQEELLQEEDHFYENRLVKIYHCLDVGIRGREAQLEYRVGRMNFPDDINEDVMMDVVDMIRSE